MQCPSCVQPIHRGAVACPHCGFSIEQADGNFGREVRLRRLSDEAGILRLEQREIIQKAMGDFSKRFPQLFLAVHTTAPGLETDLRVFGFWLLNRARFDDLPAGMDNRACILILINPQRKEACITHGYLLEPYLEQEDLHLCLARAHGHWLEGRHADGIHRLFDQLGKVLLRRSGRSRRLLKSLMARKARTHDGGEEVSL
ncbi:MAG TPA: hypothetical protein VFY13_07850 [Luteolibacter sp.]|nr:hypothetical protein [Luteolibacter sp.]